MPIQTINDMVNTAQLREDTLSDSVSWFIRLGPASFLSCKLLVTPDLGLIPEPSFQGETMLIHIPAFNPQTTSGKKQRLRQVDRLTLHQSVDGKAGPAQNQCS